ncbi:sugar phosphate nucleotidyltransferase [Terribacillus aidingensis]|uniref:sugar phosphate nucleotidyltransferase n=1 Tax=Terribacillus aidingensis TaxID=586416 RepID=UPI00344DE711
MKLILLSGGSGKRLWPLSNDARSKQFIKILEDENKNKVSMVQRVWSQLKSCGLDSQSIIATSASQKDMIYSQIGSVPLVIEPERRDTFAAIALATTYLKSELECDYNEPVIVLPVDPYVESSFFEKVKELEQVISLPNVDISLLGVKPTIPSEKYGYIQPKITSTKDRNYLAVNSFHEKPNKETAEELIKKNALWNCGVFGFKLGYLMNLLENRGLPTNYLDLLSQYDSIPKNSFDYEIVENASNVTVTPYKGYWKDLGTWNTLTDEMTDNLVGKGVIDPTVTNSHIINELDIPVTLIGSSNIVVAASADGILVSDKDSSPKVKDYVSKFNGRPMYEERRWGWYKVLDYKKYNEGNEVLTKRIGIIKGKNLSYQIHFKRSETWTIVKGEGIMLLDGEFKHIRSGDTIHIPLATKHAIKAITDIEIIEVQMGDELVEEDIHRISLEWDSIINESLLSKS